MEQHFVASGDVALAVYTYGAFPAPGEPRQIVVLAHGFPDRAELWHKVAESLQEDFFVIAFDMRGCGSSTPIHGFHHYRYARLVADLYAVIDAFSPHQKVHLVGHDWGGLYGWEAIHGNEGAKRIASFITLAPSLEQIGLFLRRRLLRPTPANLLQLFGQLGRNSLMLFFTLPILPELFWQSGAGKRLMKRLMEHFEGLPYVANAGLKGDAIRYLGIYRANLLQRVLRPSQRVSQVPVHAIIASRDPFLPPAVFEQCKTGTIDYSFSLVDASHWAPLSRHQELAATITNIAQRFAV